MGKPWKPAPRTQQVDDAIPPDGQAGGVVDTMQTALADTPPRGPDLPALVGLDGDALDIGIAEHMIAGERFDEIAKKMGVKPWQLMQFMERSEQITEFYQLVKRTKATILVDEAMTIADFFTIPSEVKKDAIAMRKWMAAILDPKTYNPQPVKGDGVPGFNLNISIGGKKTTLTMDQGEPIDVIPEQVTALPSAKRKKKDGT